MLGEEFFPIHLRNDRQTPQVAVGETEVRASVGLGLGY
jgi:hypothetical protein